MSGETTLSSKTWKTTFNNSCQLIFCVLMKVCLVKYQNHIFPQHWVEVTVWGPALVLCKNIVVDLTRLLGIKPASDGAAWKFIVVIREVHVWPQGRRHEEAFPHRRGRRCCCPSACHRIGRGAEHQRGHAHCVASGTRGEGWRCPRAVPVGWWVSSDDLLSWSLCRWSRIG